MDYQKPYTGMFNAVTDAIVQLNQNNYGTACEVLKQAQILAEERYVNKTSEK